MKTQEDFSEKVISAVKNHQLEEVIGFLKDGVNVHTQDQIGQSLLLIATRANDIEMARLLVSYNADVNLQDDRQDSPFLYAGAAGYLELVKLFLENGANFDVYNRYNGTALIPACERGHVDVVKLLAFTEGYPIDHVNRLGWTALLEAVILGGGSEKFVQVVQILVEAGCNVNIPDNDGITAMQHARLKGYKKIISVLENTPGKK